MTVIEPLVSPSKTLQVLLATVTGSVVVVDQHSREEHLVGKGPFLKLAVTPQNGKMIAAYTDQVGAWYTRVDGYRCSHPIFFGRENYLFAPQTFHEF